MKFFTWFFNLFKSNKLIMQLAIQSLAGEFFNRNPKFNVPVQNVITQVLTNINSFSTSIASLPTTLKQLVAKQTQLTAPEQALVSVFIDQLSVPIMAYLDKTNLSLPAQTAQIVEILGWIMDISKV